MTARFRHLGGSVLWKTTVLSDDDAQHLWNVFCDEAIASRAAGDAALARRAMDLADSIALAVWNARRWKRASGSIPTTQGRTG